MTPQRPAPDDADDEQEDAGEELAKRKPRSTPKRRLLDKRRYEVLDGASYAVAHVHDSLLQATFKADGITKNGGNPALVAQILTRFAKLYEALGGDGPLTGLAFGNSVTLTIRPEVDDRIRDEASELSADSEEDLTEAQVRYFVPDSVASAHAAVDLLSRPAGEAVLLAEEYGSDAADEFIKLARVLNEHEGSVTASAPGGAEATFDRHRAGNVVTEGDRERTEDRIEFWVAGRLSVADSDGKSFTVNLDRDIEEVPALHGRTQAVQGKYSHPALKDVTEGGLWDTDVRARVSAVPFSRPGWRRPKYRDFVYQEVKPLYVEGE